MARRSKTGLGSHERRDDTLGRLLALPDGVVGAPILRVDLRHGRQEHVFDRRLERRDQIGVMFLDERLGVGRTPDMVTHDAGRIEVREHPLDVRESEYWINSSEVML